MQEVNLVSTTVKAYFHERNGDLASVTMNNPNIKVDGDNYLFTYKSIKTQCMVTARAINIADKFFLHDTFNPSLESNGDFYFFLYGQNAKIEHLVCDDENKCMLKLKYSESFLDEYWAYK